MSDRKRQFKKKKKKYEVIGHVRVCLRTCVACVRECV